MKAERQKKIDEQLEKKNNCCQVVLNAFCEDFGFSPDIVIHTMESSLIYRFCKEKMGIGIDADIHHDSKLLEPLHKIPIKDAIPWKISFVYKETMKNEEIIHKLKSFAKVSTKC